MEQSLVRNFSIIAHIDHGKSTLADRILEYTHAVDKRRFHDQMLDDMDLERERGITIKASAVVINYKAKDGKEYILNLIDTPGHVDFTYEVSKSLSACEGALLVVDASQGVEAQTVANFYLALEKNLTIVPVINKIDMTSADPERVSRQLEELFGFKKDEIILASAKQGVGIEEILERIVKLTPPPKGDSSMPLQGLIFDSKFNTYKGVVVYMRIVQGTIKHHDKIILMSTQKEYEVEELGIFKNLDMVKCEKLEAGEVGYATANIRNPQEVTVGDTVTLVKNPAEKSLPGYKKLKPLVFSGIYPVNSGDFNSLREAMEKLRLSDSSFVYEPEESVSFGSGFRCGFLGLLHMEIVQERLEREYDLNLVLTSPNVVFRIKTKEGEIIEVDNPSKFPEPQGIVLMEEPIVKLSFLIMPEHLEAVCELAKSRRGVHRATEHLGQDRVTVVFMLPLAEILVDFYDRLKSATKGYGSMDYEFSEFKPTNIVKLDIMINDRLCDAFSSLVHKDKAYSKARGLVSKLKQHIPRQLFDVRIQATISNRIIAAERIAPLKKHVTGKCYGGDITRKRKLWAIQKKGKKRLKRFGKVEIPQEAFLDVLKI